MSNLTLDKAYVAALNATKGGKPARKKFQYPAPILAVYDYGDKVADRYTVILDPKRGFERERDGLYQALGLSSNPSHPQGVSMFTTSAMGRNIGRKIAWEELPEKVRKHVAARLR